VFSSGNASITNGGFVGIGSAQGGGAEVNAQVVVAAAATYTTMRCYSRAAPNTTGVYTLRKNGTNTGLSCTIAADATTGSTTPGSSPVTVAPGDLLDIAMLASGTGQAQASFAISP
jgi:hypothetical protein